MRTTRNRAWKDTDGVVPQLSLQNTDPSLLATEKVLSDAIEVRLTRLVAEAEAVRATYFAEQRAAERAALDAMGRASLRSQGNTLNRRIELMFTRAERSLIPGMGWRTVRLRKGRPPMSTYLAKVGAPRTGAALRRNANSWELPLALAADARLAAIRAEADVYVRIRRQLVTLRRLAQPEDALP